MRRYKFTGKASRIDEMPNPCPDTGKVIFNAGRPQRNDFCFLNFDKKRLGASDTFIA